MTNATLFGVAPYVAVGCLVAFTVLRFLVGREQGTLGPAQAAFALRLFTRGGAWRGGLTVLVAGHLLVLAFPRLLIASTQSLSRLVVFEAALFVAGLVALVGLVSLITGDIRDPALRSHASLADAAFLGLLLVQVGSGLSMAAVHRWGSAWATVTLAPYLHSLPTLAPELDLVQSAPYLARLHVFSALALATLFPFTHLADALLAPLSKATDLALRPLTALASRARRVLHGWARHGGRRLGWSEEED